MPYSPALPTEFEMQAKRLQLAPSEYLLSSELRRWCEGNCNRCYVPEWLLEAWDISVNVYFAGGA